MPEVQTLADEIPAAAPAVRWHRESDSVLSWQIVLERVAMLKGIYRYLCQIRHLQPTVAPIFKTRTVLWWHRYETFHRNLLPQR
jgi:hypothetical protein